MSTHMCRSIAGFSVVVTLGLVPAAAEAQLALGAYLGQSSTFDSAVRLHQPNGTDLTFHDVGWDDESWVAPRYYGIRLTYWKRSTPRWGFGLDFTHAKIYARLDATVRVTGSRDEEPVDARERLGDTFSELAMSHGHNTLTINGFYRWISDTRSGATTKLTPYVGFGVGIAVPHVEVQTGDLVTREYQRTGPTVEALGGLDFRLGWGLSIFGEYKLSSARLNTDLARGGSVRLDPWTNHFSIGLTFVLR